ncbi:MAG: cytidylyltransferase domain-containing protein [Elainellaceae cyanobacterium]
MSGIVAGIQARMGSSRLPGKSLVDLGGKPLVDWIIDRVQMATQIDQVWVLTTTNPEDDALAEAMQGKAAVLRGDALNVTSRYQQLFEKTDASWVLRITGDCPLIDGLLLDELIDQHRAHQADYSHILAQSYYDPSYPNGFNAELFTAAAFAKMRQLDTTAAALEHVTPTVDEFPEAFRIFRLAPPSELSRPDWKLSVDTATDLERVRAIVAALGETAISATAEEIIAVLDAHPEWRSPPTP